MARPRFIEIDGKRYLWRDLVRLYRDQTKKPSAAQSTLFTLQDDRRPPASRKAADRYREPGLFSRLDDTG